jgi:hypothetical protein
MRPETGDRETLSRSRIVVGAVVLGNLLVACNGEEPAGNDFLAQADEICSQAEAEIAKLERPKNLQKAQPFLEKVDAITRDALGRLDDIEPPEDQAEQFQNMIDLLKIALFYQPQLREAIRQQNVAAAQEVRVKISNALEDASKIARAFGLQVCVPGASSEG